MAVKRTRQEVKGTPMSTGRTALTQRRWFYPVVYAALVIIMLLPPYAEKAYAPQDTQDVILNLLMVSIDPYQALGPIFHIATLLIVAGIALRPEAMGRVLAAYIGLDYLAIAFLQGIGTTAKYGFVVDTGLLVGAALLGVIWLAVAVRGELQTSFRNVPLYHYILLPLAILAFWSPYSASAAGVAPNFDPRLLLTAPDYGLTFCLTTPVFLFLLILFYPRVNGFAYRATAFTGLLYGLLNMTHWFYPERVWMGVLHLPLLIISLYALIRPRMPEGEAMAGAPA